MIIVTGSSGGIGRVIALRMHNLGHKVIGISRTKNIQEVEYQTFNADVRNINELQKISVSIKDNDDPVLAIINCAGVFYPSAIKFYFEDKVFDVFDTNLKGTFNASQAFLPLMDHTKHSQIINISSLAATMTNEASAYAAAKAGVEALTKSMAKQVGMTKIRVNCIAPGPIETGFIKAMPDFVVQQGVDRQIINKFFTPDDIADIVEILLDEKTSSLTGQVFNIGGV